MSAAAILPERLAPLLAPGLSSGLAGRLLLSPRLAPRLPRLLEELLGSPALALADLPEGETRLAQASGEVLARAARLAGAVWHARRIRALLLAADVAAFCRTHGGATRRAALRHGDLAADEPGDAPLDTAIPADGAALLAAWREALPAPLPPWVALRLPLEVDAEPGKAHRERGPLILSRIAAEALAS